MAELSTRDEFHDGDMAYDMWANKWAETNIYRDPEQLYNYNRGVVADFSSDPILFPSEEPTRRYDGAMGKLNLRYSGDRADGEDPYVPDRNYEFMDKDPRGWSGEQPWNEYKRQAWDRKKNYEYGFQNDSDMSVPSQGIRPETMYYNIRQKIQPAVQARFKNFDTSLDNQQTRGVVPFDLTSDRGKVDVQKHIGSELNDMNPENINLTQKLSRDFENLGKTRQTTDHKFNVATYGMLFKAVPCMNLQSQIIYTDMGTRRAKACEQSVENRKLFAKMMDSVLASSNRQKNRHLRGEAFKNAGGNQLKSMVKSGKVPFGDILKAAGLSDQEIKWATQYVSANRGSKAPTDMGSAHHYVELTNKVPPVLRQWMLKKGNLPMGDLMNNRSQVVVNPKIREFMENKTRSKKAISDHKSKKGDSNMNSESMISNLNIQDTPLFITQKKQLENHRNILQQTKFEQDFLGEAFTPDLATPNYSSLIQKKGHKKPESTTTTDFSDAGHHLMYSNNHQMMELADRNDTTEDQETMEYGTKDRHAAPIGQKYTRRHMDTSDFNSQVGGNNDGMMGEMDGFRV